MDRNDMLSEILEVEYKITHEVKEGYTPHTNDKFETDRERIALLRCLYFGEDSKFCRLGK
jgi:hypothetical protein